MAESKDSAALDKMVQDAVAKEKELQVVSNQLAERDEQFASFIKQQKHLQETMDVLWGMAKEYMIENNITEHENDFIKLTLTPSGKYRTDDVAKVPDELCDIKKVLNNKKVKSYYELNGSLPDGVESTGYVMRKKLK